MFTREVNQGVFFITIALLLIIRDVSFVPISIKICLHIFLGMTVIIFLVTTYKYYGSLVETKKTILTYLMRALAIIGGLALVWYNIAAIVLEFPDALQPLFEKNPDLTCSILRAENVTPVIVQCLFLILYFKAYATFKPIEYLNMNHEKAYKYAMIGFGTFTIIEQLSVCLLFGTLCVTAKINHLTIAVGIDIPEKNFKRAPPLFSIHCVFLMIAGLIYAFLRHRKQKSKRKIVPTSIESPNVNITNRLTPTSHNNSSIFKDLTSSMNKSASVPYPKVTRLPSHKLYLVQEANKQAINGIETCNLFEESIIINPNNSRLDAINDTVAGNLFEESIIINPNNLRLDAINDTATGNLFKESIIINPNNLRLDAINDTATGNLFKESIIINPNNLRLDAINDTETCNLSKESIIINPNNLRLDAINDTVTGNLFEESIIINPNNLRLDAINDTVTGNPFEESIIINPNNLRLDANPKDADLLGKGPVEINTLVENNPSEKMKAEADRMKTGFSICASVLFATLCIFFATSKLSFVANLLHMSAALAIHLSAISLVLLSDEILEYMIRKFSNLAQCLVWLRH